MVDTDGFTGEKTFQHIIECMSEALIVADRNGVIRIWNPGAEALFGYTAAEALNQSLDLIIPEHLRKPHWDGFDRAIECGATAHGRQSRITRSLHKSGQQLYVDMSFAVLRDHAGATVGSIAVARDATARYMEEKRLRRQLAEQAEKPPG